ncbi:MAG: sensor histidine kinase [Bacteroidota bacterium]
MAFTFLMTGAGAMEQGMELVGGCLLFSAIGGILYLPILWMLRRWDFVVLNKNYTEKEIWGILLLIGVNSGVGALNAFFTKPAFTLFFLMVAVFMGLSGRLYLRHLEINQNNSSDIDKHRILQVAFWTFTFGIGIWLLILEEFDQQDALAITSVFYFPTLFFLAARWVFRQIKFILQLKNEQAKTELLHLKSQVSPHFFFNTLNNLYGLVAKDSQRARTLILHLSDMMRYSIYEGQKDKVSIEDEVTYLKNYIQLHRMRYHKKMDIVFDVKIEEEGIQIMPLLLIILLENAFKHGVENLIKAPFVHAQLVADKSQLYFQVTNNFDNQLPKQAGGIGLKNLQRRLELVYPQKHQLSFSQTAEIFEATLKLTR